MVNRLVLALLRSYTFVESVLSSRLLTINAMGIMQRRASPLTLGTASDGKLLAVAHTFQHTGSDNAEVRITSAREATRQERRQYENKPQ